MKVEGLGGLVAGLRVDDVPQVIVAAHEGIQQGPAARWRAHHPHARRGGAGVDHPVAHVVGRLAAVFVVLAFAAQGRRGPGLDDVEGAGGAVLGAAVTLGAGDLVARGQIEFQAAGGHVRGRCGVGPGRRRTGGRRPARGRRLGLASSLNHPENSLRKICGKRSQRRRQRGDGTLQPQPQGRGDPRRAVCDHFTHRIDLSASDVAHRVGLRLRCQNRCCTTAAWPPDCPKRPFEIPIPRAACTCT